MPGAFQFAVAVDQVDSGKQMPNRTVFLEDSAPDSENGKEWG